MSIYGRTLLFFLGAIIFQALLTAGFIIGLVSQNNQSVTRTELHEESILVYENYNKWVRHLWKTAILIRDDMETDSDNERLTNYLGMSEEIRSFLKGTGVDSFVIRTDQWEHFEMQAGTYPYLEDLSQFKMDRNHPYISLKAVEGNTFLVASVPLGTEMEVFLLKHIDDDYYNQLTTRDHTKVFLSNKNNEIWEALGSSGVYSDLLGLHEVYPPYKEMYNLEFDSGHYHVSVRNLGYLENDEELKLLVVMSVEIYFSLLYQIGRIVFIVSSLTAVFIAFLALVFTGRISLPIRNLARATREVREGNFEITVPEEVMGEMRELMNGFNSMVRHLKENKVKLDENIREITFLKDYNETIIHSLKAGILVVNENLIIEKANGFYRDTITRDDTEPEGKALKMLTTEVIDKEVRDHAAATVSGSGNSWTAVRRDKESVWEVKVYPLGDTDTAKSSRCVIEIDDISAKMELEQKILQTEKLSSLSLLSAGIAHEINNPLSTILSNAQILLSREENETRIESLEWIERETRRIADIIQDLRSFSHSEDSKESFSNMNECAMEVVRLVRYGIQESNGIILEFSPHPGNPEIAMARDGFGLVLMNLLQNSVQAMDGPGQIDLEIFDDAPENVGIIVRDTGSGIPDAILNRIYDPFFTTKVDGVGTGLGLSIVYGVIRKIGGNIDVKSRPGQGTTFKLTLPKTKDPS